MMNRKEFELFYGLPPFNSDHAVTYIVVDIVTKVRYRLTSPVRDLRRHYANAISRNVRILLSKLQCMPLLVLLFGKIR